MMTLGFIGYSAVMLAVLIGLPFDARIRGYRGMAATDISASSSAQGDFNAWRALAIIRLAGSLLGFIVTNVTVLGPDESDRMANGRSIAVLQAVEQTSLVGAGQIHALAAYPGLETASVAEIQQLASAAGALRKRVEGIASRRGAAITT